MVSNKMTVLVTAVAAWEAAKLALAEAEAHAAFVSDVAASAWQEGTRCTDRAMAVQDWAFGVSPEQAGEAQAAVQAARAREDQAWEAYYDQASRTTTAHDALETAQAAEAAAARVVAQAAEALVRTAPCGRQETHESGACECHGYNP